MLYACFLKLCLDLDLGKIKQNDFDSFEAEILYASLSNLRLISPNQCTELQWESLFSLLKYSPFISKLELSNNFILECALDKFEQFASYCAISDIYEISLPPISFGDLDEKKWGLLCQIISKFSNVEFNGSSFIKVFDKLTNSRWLQLYDCLIRENCKNLSLRYCGLNGEVKDDIFTSPEQMSSDIWQQLLRIFEKGKFTYLTLQGVFLASDVTRWCELFSALEKNKNIRALNLEGNSFQELIIQPQWTKAFHDMLQGNHIHTLNIHQCTTRSFTKLKLDNLLSIVKNTSVSKLIIEESFSMSSDRKEWQTR